VNAVWLPLYCAAVAQASGGVEINWGWLLGGLVGWIITTALTWLVAARVSTAVLRADVCTLSDEIRDLVKDIDTLRDKRAACELHAARTYVTQSQWVGQQVDLAALAEKLAEKTEAITSATHAQAGAAHERINQVLDRLTRCEERIRQAPHTPAPPALENRDRP